MAPTRQEVYGTPLTRMSTPPLRQIWYAVAGLARSRGELRVAAAAATALVDVRPVGWRNGLWSLGRPVVTTAGRSAVAVARDAVDAFAGRAAPEAFPSLDANVVASAVRTVGG